MEIIDVTPENVVEESFFCIKNPKDPGFKAKYEWYTERFKEGMRIKIIKKDKKRISFIEYIPGDFAWRPVHAPNYMFIHCVYTHPKDDKSQGNAGILLEACEDDTKKRGMSGVAVMTSDGTWITDKRLFSKNGYKEVDKLGRFELMVKTFDLKVNDPELIDWNLKLDKFKGWHLLYSDQCPYHGKSAEAIKKVAEEHKLGMKIHKVTSSKEAKQMPSGFATFNLIHNGKLLEDHYINQRRFINILNQELK